MNASKRIITVAVLLILLIGVITWRFGREQPDKLLVATATSIGTHSDAVNPVSGLRAVPQLPASEPAHYDPTLPQWTEWNRRNAQDPHWEWKVPISFFGRIVDYDTGVPIAGVEVLFQWNDLSPTGTSEAVTRSDADGFFQLTGQSGKLLSVTGLTKDGYTRSRAERPSMFEYAAFFQPNYHVPDPSQPVVFKMRKVDPAPGLFHKEGEFSFGPHEPGLLAIDPRVSLRVHLMSNGSQHERNWAASVTVSGGGIRVSTNEFPFTAPEDGYQPSLTLDTKTPKPSNWIGIYQGGQFYLRTDDGRFGRLDLKTIPSKTFMRYEVWLNPKPGSRNLEYDPNQAAGTH